ncbi:class I SAM-dependent DNA methyltransferase [Williamsia sp. MIQD14]|uniref:class I SAM-dependent DNA methyltransferase n=1 Tax=Williamsia sp. MIQD14 TaxID=3425703 RepID=UPI003D9FCB02
MTDPSYFDRMYARSDDPWGFDDHFYEQRKRDLTVAALPRARFGSALELGSSTGALTGQLLPRVDRIHCVELHPRGVDIARRRLVADSHRVRLEVADLITWTPTETYDLVVASEVLYYLDSEPLTRALGWIGDQHAAGATVVAVDWRHPVSEHRWSGDEIHRRLTEVLGAAAGGYRDSDVIIEVFEPLGTESVAVRDGLAPGAGASPTG